MHNATRQSLFSQALAGADDPTPPEASVIKPDALADCNLIVGDNLRSLRALSPASLSAIDLCYIDPPYNTGNAFIYQDKRVSDPVHMFGKHAAWMRFMFERMEAAKPLLKSTGIIAVSIDDGEQPYLRVVMDTLFGEDNFIANIAVCRSKNGMGSQKSISNTHEYLVIYGNSNKARLRGEQDSPARYEMKDEHGSYRIDGVLRKKGQDSLRSDRPNLFYPLYCSADGSVGVDPVPGCIETWPRDSKGIDRRWIWSKDAVARKPWRLLASSNGVIYVKSYFDSSKRKKVKTLWDDPRFYTSAATNEHNALFGCKVFDTPKSLEYIKKIIDISCEPDALILDFFAGSGTTAHAAHDLNHLDGGSRKTLLMESDDATPSGHPAYAKGYRYIDDVTRSRLELCNITCISHSLAGN